MTAPLSDPRLTVRAEVLAALSAAGAFCGECGFQPGETGCADCARVRELYADAVMPIVDQLRAESENRRQAAAANAASIEVLQRQIEKQASKLDRLSARLNRAEAQVHAVETVKCWTNEDGRRFVFAEDLAFALGYTPSSAVDGDCPTCGHLLCKGDGQCGAILTVFADGIRRCQCTGVDATQSAGAGQ